MWTRINQEIKYRSPHLHSALKRCAAGWRQASAPAIPCPRRIRGDFFWVHPRLLTVDTRDSEPHIWQWIRANLPEAGVFFDVGAHFGWLSLKASRHVGRTGRVFAFEPSPVLAGMLRFHQRRNHLAHLTVVENAVSERDGRTMLYLLHDGLSSRNSLTIGRPGLPFLESAPITHMEAVTISLDGFCDANRIVPDLIKIDVEGAEAMVLRGSARILAEARPVVVLSTHPYWLPPSDSVTEMMHLLHRCGYRVADSHVVSLEGYEIGDYLLRPNVLQDFYVRPTTPTLGTA